MFLSLFEALMQQPNLNSPPVFLPVVLPGGVCGIRYLPSELGWRLGALVFVGGVQQDLRGRSVLLHEAL